MFDIRRSGPGDILSLPRRDLTERDRRGLKRLTALSIWLLSWLDLELPRDWLLAFASLWVGWLTRFRLYNLFQFAIYLAVFPIVLASMPWWFGRDRQDYLLEPDDFVFRRGLSLSRPIHNWQAFRGTWIACLGLSAVALSRNDPRLSACAMALSGGVLVWSGYRCLALVAPPDLSRASIPMWALMLLILGRSIDTGFRVFAEYIEPPWLDKTKQRKSMQRLLRFVGLFNQIVRLLSARLYAGLRTRDRHVSTATVLVAQLARALVTLLALALFASFATRLYVGTSQLDGWSALTAVSSLVFPSGYEPPTAMPAGVHVFVGISSWIVLALFIAPLSYTFADWRAFRAQEIALSRPIVRSIWRHSSGIARLMRDARNPEHNQSPSAAAASRDQA